MNTHATQAPRNSVWVPVSGLTIFAIASGYLMSLLPLTLESHQLPTNAASWLASVYYLGLLFGAMLIEPVINKIGHRLSFVSFITVLTVSVALMMVNHTLTSWLLSRFVAGVAVAGVFVVIESWLLIGDSKEERAKNLGLYMTSLYGGTTLGQFGIGLIGTTGALPFIVIICLLAMATLPAMAGKGAQPKVEHHVSLSLRQILGLSKPAMVGCMVSGVVMGSIYGLLPLALQGNTTNDDRIGVLMAVTVLGGMVIQPIIGKVSCRISKSVLLALMSLLGVFAMGIYLIDQSYSIQIVSLALLGMSAFALYPIAITLACDGLASASIVSATQVMLFCYSVGSALGPLAANRFMESQYGLMGFFFAVLLSTSVYMLIASLRTKSTVVAQ
ncbi:MFS transporter [Photobacterium ganghwense]|uniref:MFS transporter n=1 Tax=Photobacterium ganghwense TaxID=320778 RepID=A0A0J1H8N9_9GAMM|nr:MFS transporter [Photobacterium ganghwense]KLV08083.1 MFS transporter [Photobacterium ganghwense]